MMDFLKNILSGVGNNLSRVNNEISSANRGYLPNASLQEKKAFQDYYMSPALGMTSQVKTLKNIPINKLDLGIPLDIESNQALSKIMSVANRYSKGLVEPIELTLEKGKYIITDGRARYWFSKLNNLDWPVIIKK